MNLVFIRIYLNALHQTRDLNETATKETELPTRTPRLSVECCSSPHHPPPLLPYAKECPIGASFRVDFGGDDMDII
jgi:hypothetical protein